jgi:hypothetical protein
MRLLVLTSEPVTAHQVRGALPDGVEPQDAEVMVVAPALAESGLRFWMSDADEDVEPAEIERQFGVPVDHVRLSA